ncbi:hypothetical protein BDN70DRAFT_921783 [Pholiota conissans]|uniref:Cation/H+ exchanger transmembrane domain-containing protein n=1 Tax=Pholiota conissans TaxID=109636 RepID=A0A9P6D0G6_9AGAR|nr:hypothetical protein BDN70DRAFT_921783 [Pholiota conissans]
MFSLLAREMIFVNEVVLGTTFGILIGPYSGGIFDPRAWGDTDAMTLELMRIVLATGLFAIGVELPKSYMWQHSRSLMAMVIPTMAIGWIIVAGLLRLLFPVLDFVSCLAISACLTPTDPIICAAIVGGKFAQKHVPVNLRQLLSAESAANDGLAYPFLTLAIYMTIDSSKKAALTHWVFIGWLYEVVLGVVMGAIIGLMFSHLMKYSRKRGYINRESYVAQYLALAVFITGFVSLVGSDDLLAAFAAGSAISWDGEFNTHTEGESFASVIELLLNCGCFIYIGAWLPFDSFTMPELGITPWRLLVLSGGIMFLRRIPAILTLYRWIPEIASWREALFSGHFGPVGVLELAMGVGAVFISTLAVHRLGTPTIPPITQQDHLTLAIHPVVCFVVLASIVIHGLSIPFFNMGRNITQTITISKSLPSYPDWLTGVSRNPVLPREPDTERAASPSRPGVEVASKVVRIADERQPLLSTVQPLRYNGDGRTSIPETEHLCDVQGLQAV